MADGIESTTEHGPEPVAEHLAVYELEEPSVASEVPPSGEDAAAAGGDPDGESSVPDASIDDMTDVLEAGSVASSPGEGGLGEPEGRLTKKGYERAMAALQPDLTALQQTIRDRRLKVVVLFEGRDAGRKASAVHSIAKSMDVRVCRVVTIDAPTERERRQWPFQRFVARLPAEGEIVLVDGSWYGQAMADDLTGLRDDAELSAFLAQAVTLERLLVDSGFTIVKCWLADGEEGGEPDREMRTLARRWNADRDDLDDCTQADLVCLRSIMIEATAWESAPWYLAFCDDRREARLRCVRYLLDRLAYAAAGEEGVGGTVR